MQKLANTLTKSSTSADIEALREAAKDWAGHALDTYKDELLDKAIKISTSIAAFLNEMESDLPTNDN